jgi:hypothetical protein
VASRSNFSLQGGLESGYRPETDPVLCCCRHFAPESVYTSVYASRSVHAVDTFRRDRSTNRHRYTEANLVEMWDRFENGQKYDIGLGTVFFLAQRAGWDRQVRGKEIGRKIRGRRVLARAAQVTVRDSVADQAHNEDEAGQACPRPPGQAGPQLPEAADK